MLINGSNLSQLYMNMRATFNQSMEQAESYWRTIAMEVVSSDRTEDYAWIGEFPAMKEWVGERVIKNLSAFHYELTNKDFESTVEVDRNDIEDDRVGIYRPMVAEMGRVAKQHPDILIFSLMKAGFLNLCYDGQYFFDADHVVAGASVSNTGGGSGEPWFLLDCSRGVKPFIMQFRKRPQFVQIVNPEQSDDVFMRKKYRYGVDDRKNAGYGLWQLAYASKQTLDATSYAAARAAMMSFKNDEGVPLGIKPTHLVVPPASEEAANKLIKTSNNDAGAGNPWFQSVDLLVVPGLHRLT